MNDTNKSIAVGGVCAFVQKLAHGGVVVSVLGGLTATEIAAFGGLIVAALGYLTNSIMTFYFKWKHYKLAERLGKPSLDE